MAGIFLGREDQMNTVMAIDRASRAEWLRRGAAAVAVGRIGLGVAALARPAALTRPWVGPTGEDRAGRLLGRALGGRDLALGLGTVAALRQASAAGSQNGNGQAAATWVGLAAVADGFDLLITAAYWGQLPARSRWLIAASAGGAAGLGLAAAVATR